MRKGPKRLLAPLALLVACGGEAPLPVTPLATSNLAPAASSPAGALPPSEVPFDFGLPAASCLTATLNPSKLGPAEKILSTLQPDVEEALGVSHVDGLHRLLASQGVDDARPITLVLLPPAEDAKRAISSLRSLVPAESPEAVKSQGGTPPAPVFDALRKAVDDLGPLAVYRVLLPATDPAKLMAAIDRALGRAHWKASDNGRYTSTRGVAVATAGAGVVALDIVLGRRPDDGLKQLASALAARTAAHADIAAPDNAAARIVYAPECVAETGFLSGVTLTVGALSGGSIDTDQKERIAGEGLWESERNILLARGERGARFDRIDLAVSLDGGRAAMTMRAEPGPAFDGPADDAWDTTFTVAGTALPLRTFDASRPFLSAWKLPGASAQTALDPAYLLRTVRDAGSAGLLVALPDEVASGAGLFVDPRKMPPRDVVDRLARVALVSVRGPSSGMKAHPIIDVFLGVLPEGTTPAAAECVLSGAAPCGAKKLAVGVVRKALDGYARVVQVDKRYVLVYAADAKVVALSVKSESAGPIRILVDANALPIPMVDDAFPGEAFAGTMKRDGKAIVFEVVAE